MSIRKLKKEELIKKLNQIEPDKTVYELEEILRNLEFYSTVLIAQIKSIQNERPIDF